MKRPRWLVLAAATLLIGATAAPLSPPPMASYVFGLLRRGPAWTPERNAYTDSLQRGHMANIQRMADEGLLLGAGPFLDGGDLRGIFIFRPDSLAALRAHADRDPAIRAGRLALDLYAWHASVGIGEPYRRLAAQPGHKDSMVRLTLGFLRKGPKWTDASSSEIERQAEERDQNVFRGLASGELAMIGGPLEEGATLRFSTPPTADRYVLYALGVMVFRGDSAFARRFASRDPQVKSGRMALELHPWMVGYGVMPGDTSASR